MVAGLVKRSAYDAAGQGTIDPDAVAAKFWALYSARTDVRAKIA